MNLADDGRRKGKDEVEVEVSKATNLQSEYADGGLCLLEKMAPTIPEEGVVGGAGGSCSV